jgi:hypothetical protein
MRDALGSTSLEESGGVKYTEWSWGPHVKNKFTNTIF